MSVKCGADVISYTKYQPVTGTLEITSNGTYDVTNYASADVDVPEANILTATNTTGSAIASGDKVWIEPVNVEEENFTVVGSPTVNNTTKTVTNFSASNYISCPAFNTQTANTWEIVLKTNFAYINSSSHYSYFIRSQSLQIYSGPTTSGLQMGYKANGEWNWTSPTAYNMVNGIQYIKVVFDGTNYEGFVSQDGENWNLHFSFQGSKADYEMSDVLNIGSRGDQNRYFAGTLYTNDETYIKVDGNIVWTPYKETVVGYDIIPSADITSTSFTGVAQEAIENNATGSVKTILPNA